jgi:hypothetical protein
MNRFYGNVGFVKDKETAPGVIMPTIIEKPYYGTINRQNRRWDTLNEVNDHLTLSEEISIVADDYFYENIGYIAYVVRLGVKWKVKTITPSYPRIILELGGEYNG